MLPRGGCSATSRSPPCTPAAGPSSSCSRPRRAAVRPRLGPARPAARRALGACTTPAGCTGDVKPGQPAARPDGRRPAPPLAGRLRLGAADRGPGDPDGTPGYVAPEARVPTMAVPTHDHYAAGMTAAELTGRPHGRHASRAGHRCVRWSARSPTPTRATGPPPPPRPAPGCGRSAYRGPRGMRSTSRASPSRAGSRGHGGRAGEAAEGQRDEARSSPSIPSTSSAFRPATRRDEETVTVAHQGVCAARGPVPDRRCAGSSCGYRRWTGRAAADARSRRTTRR